MKIKRTLVTDTGIVLDPDDDVEIVDHSDVLEITHNKHIIYCSKIHNYYYDIPENVDEQ